jgi:Sulfotransferase family
VKQPENALILLTSHRSGSTWLSDAIRAHPAVEYYPTAILSEQLGISGRRYPGDLSNKIDGCYEIEVQPGKWDKIPQFDVSSDLDPQSRSLHFEPYAIEKYHPSFFDFDVDRFLQGIQILQQSGTSVKLVYLVRDPKSLISSFLNYQSRQPSWYAKMMPEQIPKFLYQTYEFIHKVMVHQPGYVLDYRDLKTDLAYQLVSIYLKLWSNLSRQQEDAILQVSELASKSTDRFRRMTQTGSPFLGETEGSIQGGDSQYNTVFDRYQDSIEECYEVYHRVRSNHQL